MNTCCYCNNYIRGGCSIPAAERGCSAYEKKHGITNGEKLVNELAQHSKGVSYELSQCCFGHNLSVVGIDDWWDEPAYEDTKVLITRSDYMKAIWPDFQTDENGAVDICPHVFDDDAKSCRVFDSCGDCKRSYWESKVSK